MDEDEITVLNVLAAILFGIPCLIAGWGFFKDYNSEAGFILLIGVLLVMTLFSKLRRPIWGLIILLFGIGIMLLEFPFKSVPIVIIIIGIALLLSWLGNIIGEKQKRREAEIKRVQLLKKQKRERQEEEKRKKEEEKRKKEEKEKAEKAYKRFYQRQKAKGLVKHNGYWWKPEELEAKKRFDEFWKEKEKSQDFKGDWMHCESCHYEWKIKKERGLPARCMRCNSTNIELNKEYSYPSKNKGYPEMEDKVNICPHCGTKLEPKDIHCPECGRKV